MLRTPIAICLAACCSAARAQGYEDTISFGACNDDATLCAFVTATDDRWSSYGLFGFYGPDLPDQLCPLWGAPAGSDLFQVSRVGASARFAAVDEGINCPLGAEAEVLCSFHARPGGGDAGYCAFPVFGPLDLVQVHRAGATARFTTPDDGGCLPGTTIEIECSTAPGHLHWGDFFNESVRWSIPQENDLNETGNNHYVGVSFVSSCVVEAFGTTLTTPTGMAQLTKGHRRSSP